MNIIFVCTGNTCRSPMAEGYFKSLCEKSNNKNIVVLSAGTFSNPNSLPSLQSIQIMESYDIDIKNYRSSQISIDLINKADLIITMTEGHKAQILLNSTGSKEKTHLLLEYVDKQKDVADPFGGSFDTYKMCFREMKEALDNLFCDIINE